MKLSLDFAFEGFRIIRQRPVVIPLWGVFLLIGYGLAYGLLFAMAWQPLMEMSKVSAAGAATADPQQVLRLFGQLIPAYLVTLVVIAIVYSIISCAIYRAVLDSPQKSFGGLRLGGDELRLIAVFVIYIFLFFALEIVVGLALGLITGLLSVVPGLNKVAPIIAGLAALALFVWVLTRLSLAGVQSFAEKKINLFGSWSVTKGNSLVLLVGYIIAFVMAMLVELCCGVIFVAILMITTGGHFTPPPAGPNMLMGLAGMALPVLICIAVLCLVVLPLMIALMVGAPAAAFKQLRGLSTSVQNVF